MRRAVLIVALMGAVCGTPARAHGGGLNAEGCHHNRKTGDYHCHRAPVPAVSKQQPLVVKSEPLHSPQQTLRDGGQPPQRAAAAAPHRPACYVGPRGGTYTITASGRKNYGGC
ncbi:MAG TPA: YHYH domain-containing protein [Methylibium sp.]|uniref:YHYH domain-containing protein n=1 Tax=Methylibium sp. TaxID=2067992 RepID=UPI002DB888DF|nr:YHYH domain-containing protein [Methylibium sp.]HEU4457766.1 YHYH domain-containing protein [Methylibium sp.]